jgi:hypothetical protein
MKNNFTRGQNPKDAMGIGNVEERKENRNADYMIKFQEIINKI